MTPSATEKLIQVCEALDEKLACIVKDVETYQKTMNSIDESMRSGFMGLAQTRYAKGRDAVSLWKIPATMEARIGM